jgi:septum formation protein
MQKIILASGSPRRKQILELANIPFTVNIPETDENHPHGLSPEQVAIYIARNKAMAIYNGVANENQEPSNMKAPVLSADTIVVLDHEIIGKPVDRNDAIKILQKLSGKKHLVITGVVIFYNNTEVAFAAVTEVEFHALNNEQITYYIDNFKPFDKAGAYAIQEWIGAVGVKNINGDFYNVMGLPVSRVLIELQKINK